VTAEEVKDRALAAVVGSVVADAASLGFHWLYDQTRIAEVVATIPGGNPEFVAPDAKNYKVPMHLLCGLFRLCVFLCNRTPMPHFPPRALHSVLANFDANNTQDTMGFFAWPTKKAGDNSFVGEFTMATLRSIAASGGKVDVADLRAKFLATFGVGGTYVGYADTPIKDTVCNMYERER
jgi:hypothetical protein